MAIELDELNTSAENAEELDAVDNTSVDEDVDNTSDEVTDTDSDTESVTTDDSDDINEMSSESENNTDETPDDINAEDLSGIERYLSKFNIDAGVISFEDGSNAHFNDLTPEKQANVLTKLHETSTQDIEEKYGLDESEIGLINYLREQGKTIDEVVNDLATQRANTYISSKEIQTKDVTKMTSDEVYTSFLLKSNPKSTTEQLETDLASAKAMSNFEGIVGTIRTGLVQEQSDVINKSREASKTSMINEIESQREQVVNVVSKMKDIDGLAVNDGIKNDVLDLILNVDDDGDSKFMTEVFSDPEALFKAAFWYKNGSDIIASREEHWRKEKSAAYKRGKKDGGSEKRTFSADEVAYKNKTTPHLEDYEDISSFDDLYNS